MTVVWGTNNSETLDQADGATNFADTLLGLEGNDKLFGLKGNDWLKGGGGADELHGGDGIDWADYSDATGRVQVNLATGKGSQGYAEGDTYDSIENVWGSGYGDAINGNNADNEFFGGGGDDWLFGNGGGDILDGGPSFDVAAYWYSAEGVFIDLAAGTASGGDAENDTLLNIEGVGGSEFDDILVGDGQANYLTGYAGDDALKGAGGDDELSGGLGADQMVGGPDDDTYYVDEAGDVVSELVGEGVDSVNAWISAGATYTLPDNVEHLSLTGGATNGNGNALENTLHGSGSANVLNGLGGQDRLYGHDGGDTFAWSAASHTGLTAATADMLMDFDAAELDKINLSPIDADVYTAGNQAFTFIGSNAFSGTAGEVNYYHAGGNTYIQMQTGTSVDVEGVIYMPGIVTPLASWFML